MEIKFFRPGYSGGLCFPRDTRALKLFVDKNNISSKLLAATTEYNKDHILFQTKQLINNNPEKTEFIITDICFKENSKIPIIEESAKLKIAENLVKLVRKL